MRHRENTGPSPSGRWPANLVLDEEAGAWMDEVVGELHTHSTGKHAPGDYEAKRRPRVYGVGLGGSALPYGGNKGGPSRFFYTSKTSRSEREAGLIGKIPCGTCGGIDTETHLNAKGKEVRCIRNGHPTVKPKSLMAWLCRLVTPPGGVVLDPFAGSGTTAIAAGLEGFTCLACEKDEEYVRIAEARLAHWMEQPMLGVSD